MKHHYSSIKLEFSINSYIKYFSLLLLFLVASMGYGQTVTLGSGTTVSTANSGSGLGPVNQYYAYMHYQVVYTAAELITAGAPSGGGLISSFGWNVSTAPANAIPNYSVRMAHTTATNSAAHNTTVLTTVYGATNTAFVTGFNMLTLTGAGFNWNGTDNLLVDICNSSASTFGSPYGQVYTYGTAVNSSRFFRRDGTGSACAVATDQINGWKPQARFTFTSLVACTGTPVGGTVTASPTTGSPGSAYGVNAIGYTAGTGLTYQWQRSDNGGTTWNNQGTATSSYTPLTGMIAPALGVVMTWRLVVTCTASASSANSTTGTFTSAITYCTPTNTYSTSYYISGVTTTGGITNINNSPTGFSEYTDYTSFFVSQYPGSSFTLNATHPSSTNGYKVWIDWNGDGDFDDTGENVISTGYVATPANLGTITIPGGQAAGNYRMRIRNAYLSNPAPACGSFDYGEAEDYTVRVILPALPTITSLSATVGCTGSSLTITGTNFLGGTVRIGGTVAAIASNTGTSITVTVGTGTTGTVTVTTPGGTATSAATFTVHPIPANPGAPTSNSPQCNPPGVILTRAGTVPTGVTWYWQTTANGTATTNSGATNTVLTSGTYYIRAQNDATGCWSAGSGTRAVVVHTPNPNAATAPNPTNGKTGVCYAGSNPTTSLTWGNVANVTSYDVYFGTDATPIFVGNRTTNNYPTGVLAANTTYYWKIVPKNLCGERTGAIVTWSFTTSSAPCHCIPTNTYSTSYFISGVTTTGGIANFNNTPTGFSAYTDYTAFFVSQFPGSSFNLTATHPSSTYGYKVWIDWNNDGDFDDAGENVFTSAGYLGTPANLGAITIPGGQAGGDYRMRIRNAYLGNPPPACGSFDYGEAEDYTVRVIIPDSPTITSVNGTEGCTNSLLTITGTNFLGATVTIGGTLTTITANTGTLITVRIGTGTTGPVTITTPGGTATSATNFTVNTLPDLPPNTLTSDSPQCNPPGVTISHPDTAPSGVTWYWQTAANGTNTDNNADTPITVTTSGRTYIRAQDNATGCWSTTSRNILVSVTNAAPTAAATSPNPVNNATGVCYAGVSPVTSLTWGGVANISSYDVYFGTTPVPPLAGNRTVNNYPTGGLAANTTYYWRIVPKNGCGETTATPVTWSFTTASGPCYCTLDVVTNTSTYIDNFSTSSGDTNISNLGSGFTPGGYQDNYASMTVSQYATGSVTFALDLVGGSAGVAIWVDWNNNGVFVAGERVFNTNGYVTAQQTGTITVPNGTAIGDYRMRVKIDWSNQNPDPCTSSYRAETEDYKFTVITTPPCAAQPSNLSSSAITTTSARISWTVASPAPSVGYNYYYSTSPTSPTAGTTPSGNVTATPWRADLTPLLSGTTYYFWVRSDCGADKSSWAGPGTFTTKPVNDFCSNAIDLACGTINLPGTTSGTTSIATISGCSMSSYGVWYTFVGDGDASTISSTSTGGFDHEMSISTGNCTNQFNIVCLDNATGNGTETHTFNTTVGVQYYVYIAYYSSYDTDTGNFTISRTCSPPTYCIPSSTSSSYYINNFSTSGGSTNITNNNSGYSAGGYGNFTSLNVTQINGGVVNFNVSHPGSQTYGFNIWVDWNDDLDFDDPGEKVFASGGYFNTLNGSFTVPISAPPGPHRMRIRSTYYGTDPDPCAPNSESEAEDYTLIVTELNCTANPSNVIAAATSTTAATISWTAAAPPPGLGYEYLVSTNASGTPVITTGTTAGTTVNITGLLAGTTYYVFVRGLCNAIDKGYWVMATLTTGCTTIVTTPTVCPLIIDVQGNNPLTTFPFVADPTVHLECEVASVNLVANVTLREPTSYLVEQVTYPNPEPLYAFPIAEGSGTAQPITSDDVWANSRTNLGFRFCFYGNSYTQTLVGANSVITFNPSIAAGSASGYSFSNNLPSTAGALFEQAIYGVYHDIDPRGLTNTPIRSRTVGAAPCRQFQVSWNDVPMFGDATRLYTGMIVLHETTNIIEVFIKEKRISKGNVNPWNGGNALVGIQGTVSPPQYAVAPCRNTLDENWEATNEAWRFTPNGAVIVPTSITWYQTAMTVGNIIPSNPDNSVTVSAQNTYFASVKYALCSGNVNLTDEIVVTTDNKVWTGAQNNNWFNANNWLPKVIPTAADCLTIPNIPAPINRNPIADITATDGGTAFAKNIKVINNGLLTVNPDTYLEVTEWLNIQTESNVMLRNNASLIQIEDVTDNNNTGDITLQRTVPGGVLPQNYVYWSSPVENFDVGDINTAPSEQRFEWNPTIDGVGNGNWEPANGPMSVGKGYIVKGLAIPPSPIPAQTAQFFGRPSNGIINKPINRGTYVGPPYLAAGGGNTVATDIDDNWNLIGNPYPSALSADAFISTNAAVLEDGPSAILGTIYLWSHNGLPSGTTEQDPFYGNYVYNYLGSDYVAYNATGSNPPVFNSGMIAAGQSFFVQMDDAAGITNNVIFNNSMRSRTFQNDQFLRTAERHRIWLDLINSSDVASSTLIGYVSDATNDKDRLYDGHDLSDTSLQFYSLIGEENMTIQGRALPFEQEDRVPLGFVVPQNSSYKIAINTLDGLFGDSSQTIYLEDTYMNTIFDLRTAPYAFTSEIGTFNDRFILRYTNETLSTPDQVANFGFNIIGLKDYIKVTSGNSLISTVKVYDVLGRVLADYKNINALEFKFDLVNQSEGTLIVKATLYNGQQKIKKVIY